MEMVPITDDRMGQLAECAQRCGKDTAAALDLALAEYLAVVTFRKLSKAFRKAITS